jgi:hypothetical protein
MNNEFIKFPRTPHIAGSAMQPGDYDLKNISLPTGVPVMVTEKLDGANAGISFTDGELRLQSRGHYLQGGPREKQFDMLKQWAAVHRTELWQVLGTRYVIFGEWLYATHTIYYNQLPDYFMEFDVFDRDTGLFLDTATRHELLSGLPITSMPVLYSGHLTAAELLCLLGRSQFFAASDRSFPDYIDASGMMEGLYIKVEQDGQVVQRCKYVRETFKAKIDEHWTTHKMLRNEVRNATD